MYNDKGDFKLNSLSKLKWVQALRNGEYKQVYGKLTSDCGGFCALGVACSIGVAYANKDNKTVFGGDLPGYLQGKITFMNDVDKLTFNEIADWIEENL